MFTTVGLNFNIVILYFCISKETSEVPKEVCDIRLLCMQVSKNFVLQIVHLMMTQNILDRSSEVAKDKMKVIIESYLQITV